MIKPGRFGPLDKDVDGVTATGASGGDDPGFAGPNAVGELARVLGATLGKEYGAKLLLLLDGTVGDTAASISNGELAPAAARSVLFSILLLVLMAATGVLTVRNAASRSASRSGGFSKLNGRKSSSKFSTITSGN